MSGSRIKKIKQQIQQGKLQFINQLVGFGKFKYMTWKQVQQKQSWYIKWLATKGNDDINRDIAIQIFSKRGNPPIQIPTSTQAITPLNQLPLVICESYKRQRPIYQQKAEHLPRDNNEREKLSRIKKIKQQIKQGKLQFMNELLGFGHFQNMTWQRVYQKNYWYIISLVTAYDTDEINRDIAIQICSKKGNPPIQIPTRTRQYAQTAQTKTPATKLQLVISEPQPQKPKTSELQQKQQRFKVGQWRIWQGKCQEIKFYKDKQKNYQNYQRREIFLKIQQLNQTIFLDQLINGSSYQSISIGLFYNFYGGKYNDGKWQHQFIYETQSPNLQAQKQIKKLEQPKKKLKLQTSQPSNNLKQQLIKSQNKVKKQQIIKIKQRSALFKKPYLDYVNWIRNRFYSQYRVCGSGVNCYNQGYGCKYDHVSVWTQSQYIHRLEYYKLEDQLEELIKKYKFNRNDLLQIALKSTNQYKQAVKRIQYLQHILEDHGKTQYDVSCFNFITQKCKEKIKQDQTFMNNLVGFGKKHHSNTWKNVQKYDPKFIDWVNQTFRQFDCNKHIAAEIIRRRTH